MAENIVVTDCDGHLMESVAELAEFADEGIAEACLRPRVFLRGPFPHLDGLHFGGARPPSPDQPPKRPRVNASDHRMGSAEDWQAFLEKAEVKDTVLFTSDGLTIGFIRLPDYATRLCRAYNDYIAERYRRKDPRIHPMALIPMQDPKAAVLELRRAVKDLDLPGAMLPATGLPLDLGHEIYWPVYEEAANLGCVLGIHGGSNLGIGLDTLTSLQASHVLHHPVPLMIACVSQIYNGLFDRYPDLRVSYLEGGCAWAVLMADRMERDRQFLGGPKRTFDEYLTSGQMLIGCEGEDPSLPYLAKRVGITPFAYSSDYPHEVDMVAAKHEIDETLESNELTHEEKVAVLGENARRFFRL